MKYALSTALNVILWVLIIILFFMVGNGVYQRYLSKGSYSGLFGLGYAVVVSGSMEPVLHVDDMIVFQKLSQEEYEVGDIIVYVREKEDGTTMLITHRITSIDGDTLVTTGDANHGISDPAIKFDKVVGRVSLRIPAVGKAVTFLRTKKGLLVAGAGFAILLLLLFVTSASDKRKSRKPVHE